MIKYFIYKSILALKYLLLNKRYKISSLQKKNKFTDNCVIIGNGPSLGEMFENKLIFFQNKDLYVVNNFSLSDYFFILKPKFYIIIDPAFWNPIFFDNHKNTIDNINKSNWGINLILPIDAKFHLNTKFINNEKINIYYFSNISFDSMIKLNFLYTNNILNPHSQNVLVYTLFLAINNKHKCIYLTGSEHSWLNTLMVNNMNIVCAIDKHFYESDVKLLPYLTCYGKPYKLHDLLNDFAKMFKGYHEILAYSHKCDCKIFNLTNNSFIDAFDRKNISHLI
jgi:hypothetical protein